MAKVIDISTSEKRENVQAELAIKRLEKILDDQSINDPTIEQINEVRRILGFDDLEPGGF